MVPQLLQGHGSISITIHDLAEVAIEVWDQGQGMPANAWERALQPFQRLDSTQGVKAIAAWGWPS